MTSSFNRHQKRDSDTLFIRAYSNSPSCPQSDKLQRDNYRRSEEESYQLCNHVIIADIANKVNRFSIFPVDIEKDIPLCDFAFPKRRIEHIFPVSVKVGWRTALSHLIFSKDFLYIGFYSNKQFFCSNGAGKIIRKIVL